jgi:hypothetical protein
LSVLIDIPRLTNKVSACLLQLHGERKIREIKTQITVRWKQRACRVCQVLISA